MSKRRRIGCSGNMVSAAIIACFLLYVVSSVSKAIEGPTEAIKDIPLVLAIPVGLFAFCWLLNETILKPTTQARKSIAYHDEAVNELKEREHTYLVEMVSTPQKAVELERLLRSGLLSLPLCKPTQEALERIRGKPLERFELPEKAKVLDYDRLKEEFAESVLKDVETQTRPWKQSFGVLGIPLLAFLGATAGLMIAGLSQQARLVVVWGITIEAVIFLLLAFYVKFMRTPLLRARIQEELAELVKEGADINDRLREWIATPKGTMELERLLRANLLDPATTERAREVLGRLYGQPWEEAYAQSIESSGPLPRPPIPDELRKQVLERDNYVCRYCSQRAQTLDIDHVIPVNQGGPTILSNLVTACSSCNRKKAGRAPWEAGMEVIPLRVG